jgi:hypothetical protein
MSNGTDPQTVPVTDQQTVPAPGDDSDPLSSALADIDPKMAAVYTAAGETPSEKASMGRMEKMFESELTDAAAARKQQAEFASTAAQQLREQAPQLAAWANSMPSQQGIYANTMQMAPMFAIMAALGGRATSLTGLQMLSATTGLVQGLNAGARDKYEAASRAWQQAFETMQAHLRLQSEYYRMMLDAYAGRADADEKAALAVERMMGNMRTTEQRRQMTAVQAYKAVQAAGDKAFQHNLAQQKFDEQKRRDDSYIERNKTLNARTAAAADKLPAAVKARLDYYDRQLRATEDDARLAMERQRNAINDPRLTKEQYGEVMDWTERTRTDAMSRMEQLTRAKEELLDEYAPLGPTPPGGQVPPDSPIMQPATGGATTAAPRAAPPSAATPPPPGSPGGNPLEDPAVRARRMREQQAGPGRPLVDPPAGLPSTDPQNSARHLIQYRGSWVYATTDGKDWRPLTPQEQAKVQAPPPAPSAQTPGYGLM